MKQLYKVPFERNSERIKELCCQYVQVRLCNTVITVHHIVCFAVNYSINLEYCRKYSKAFTHTVSDYFQRVMELEANQVPHEMIYVDKAGFNLAKRRRPIKKHNWQKGHSYLAGPERSQHHHVCRNLQQCCTPE